MHILPGSATHHLLLHGVGIVLGRVVAQVGVHVAHLAGSRLRIGGGGPLRHVSGHVVEAELVGGDRADTGGDQVAILGVIALARLEVAQETALVVLQLIGGPRELILVLSILVQAINKRISKLVLPMESYLSYYLQNL